MQLILALAGTLRVRQRPHTRWRRYGAVIVPPDAAHEVQASGLPVLIAFIDRESEIAAALVDRMDASLLPVSGRIVASWRRHLGDPAGLDGARVERWVRSALLRSRTAPPIHPAVRRVLRRLRQEPLDSRRATLPSLARVAGLSPSRFMHVFTESVGIPLRPYLLWLRVQRAATALGAGSTVTEAAYIAGFADGAHLARTFRRMLGTTPRDLRRRTQDTRELRLESNSSQFVQDGLRRSPE